MSFLQITQLLESGLSVQFSSVGPAFPVPEAGSRGTVPVTSPKVSNREGGLPNAEKDDED